MKILIFGSKGYLGTHFRKLYPNSITPIIDISQQEEVRNELDNHHPDIVINCAGKTGRPNVDWCEDHKFETLQSNTTGPLILLNECLKRGIYLVHISTGCIYRSLQTKAYQHYTEEDLPNFFGSWYSKTKGWTDQALKDFPVLQLRPRMPFDDSDHPRNLLNKLIKYDKVIDAENSLTHIPNFMNAAKILIERERVGIYNIVNSGYISPFRIMQLYRRLNPNHKITKIRKDELVTKAQRSNCTLSNEKLLNEGLGMPNVHEVLVPCLEKITMSRTSALDEVYIVQ